MMSEQISQQEVARLALDEALKLGCQDVSVLCAVSNENQVRFANNSITLVNSVRNITLDVYLALAKKRIVGSSYNPTGRGIERFVGNLVRSCRALPESDDYVHSRAGPSATGLTRILIPRLRTRLS